MTASPQPWPEELRDYHEDSLRGELLRVIDGTRVVAPGDHRTLVDAILAAIAASPYAVVDTREPTTDQMIDALLIDNVAGYGLQVELAQNGMGGVTHIYKWGGGSAGGWNLVASKHGVDWRDALREAWRSVREGEST